MAAFFKAGGEPGCEGLVEAFEAAPIEESSRIEKDDEEDRRGDGGNEVDERPFGFGPGDGWRGGAEFLPEDERGKGEAETGEVDDVGLLGEDHSGDAASEREESTAFAGGPDGEDAPSGEEEEEDEAGFMNRVAPVEDERGRDGHDDGGPTGGGRADESAELEGHPDGGEAGDDGGEAEREEVAAEELLRDEDAIHVQRAVIVRGVVVVVALLGDAIGEPAIDAFVEVRRLEVERSDAENHGGDENEGFGPKKTAGGHGLSEIPGMKEGVNSEMRGFALASRLGGGTAGLLNREWTRMNARGRFVVRYRSTLAPGPALEWSVAL